LKEKDDYMMIRNSLQEYLKRKESVKNDGNSPLFHPLPSSSFTQHPLSHHSPTFFSPAQITLQRTKSSIEPLPICILKVSPYSISSLFPPFFFTTIALNPRFVKYYAITSILTMFSVFIILLGFFPPYASLSMLINICNGIFILFSINLDTFRFLIKSFEFWFTNFFVISFVIEFCFLVRDIRCLIGISMGGTMILYCALDAFPEIYREKGRVQLLFRGLGLFAFGACFHFRAFVNIENRFFSFNGIEWNLQQLVESTVFNLGIWLTQFAIFSFLFPGELIFVKMAVRRVDDKRQDVVEVELVPRPRVASEESKVFLTSIMYNKIVRFCLCPCNE